MKTILTILVICLSFNNFRAQTSENAYYLSSNGYFGNYIGGELGANFNSKVGYTVKFSPSLYFNGMFFNPKEVIFNYNLLAGKIINLDTESKIKLRLMAGAGLSSISENRYEERYEIANLIINPVLEFLILPFYGLSISPVLILNKDYPMFGIGFGSMLGYLRKFPEKGISN